MRKMREINDEGGYPETCGNLVRARKIRYVWHNDAREHREIQEHIRDANKRRGFDRAAGVPQCDARYHAIDEHTAGTDTRHVPSG